VAEERDEQETAAERDSDAGDSTERDDAAPAAAAPVARADAGPVDRKVRIKVQRQDAPDKRETRRVEEFVVPWSPRLSLSGALRRIELDPVTADGRSVPAVAWEAGCLEEICGACTMLVNGRVAQACGVLVDVIAPKGQVIHVAPLSRFPLVRDLVVDRSRIGEDSKRAYGWTDVEPGPGTAPAIQSPGRAAELAVLGRCTGCGACLEACPEYGEHADFVGAAVLNQVQRLNLHPVGALNRRARLESMMGPGGVADCGKSQNCVEVCPMQIPLVDSIQAVAKDTSRELVFGWLLGARGP
jgi:succinate dehydrogenase / fumarate reductase, iron-sulfur subunit